MHVDLMHKESQPPHLLKLNSVQLALLENWQGTWNWPAGTKQKQQQLAWDIKLTISMPSFGQITPAVEKFHHILQHW